MPARSSSSGNSGSKRLSPPIDSHRLKTTSGAKCVDRRGGAEHVVADAQLVDGEAVARQRRRSRRSAVPRMSSRARFSGSASAPSKSRLKMTRMRGLAAESSRTNHSSDPVRHCNLLANVGPSDRRRPLRRSESAANVDRRALAPSARRRARRATRACSGGIAAVRHERRATEVTRAPDNPQGTIRSRTLHVQGRCSRSGRSRGSPRGGGRERRTAQIFARRPPTARARRAASPRRSPARRARRDRARHRLDVADHAARAAGPPDSPPAGRVRGR